MCAIESAKISGYDNDPLTILDGMELKFNLIKYISGESVFTTKQITVQVFQALLTTTNQDFKFYVNGKKDPFDKGNDVDTYSIIKLVQTYYINNKNKFEAVDSKDTAIIALTTKLNSLEEKLKNQGGSNSGKGGS
eukprot:1343871-Ditylum_brightwellii.AAC.1